MENNKKKLVVYTCITNDYDTLRDIPKSIFERISNSVEFVCFTDNPDLYSISKTWKIREIPEDLVKLNKVKAQRILKVAPFRYVDDIADISLWVDSNLAITGNPLDILSKCNLKKFPLWTFKHPQRNCIYDEELAVVRLKKEKLDIAVSQIEKYMKDRYPIKNGLAETNMILRDNNDPLMKKMSYMWAKEIIDGSHRDQLSFNYCCWKTGLKYGEFDGSINKMFLRLPHKSPEKLKIEIEKKKREEENKRKIETLEKIINENKEDAEKRKRESEILIKKSNEQERKILEQQEVLNKLQKILEDKIKKESSGTIDVVYVIGNGSSHSNDELRFSLRSIEKYFKDLRNVFIVGSKPDFIDESKVIFIPTDDICEGDLANKDRNHWHNMEIVCKDPRLSEKFLFAADDFLITKPSIWDDFIPRHTGIPSKRYMDSGNYNPWRKTRIETLKRFPENKRFLWHPHMMSQMEKKKVLQCCKDSDYRNRNDVIIFTYYYNHEPMPTPVPDFDTDEVHTARKMDLSKRHISHWDAAFSYKPFREQLDKMFPAKSRFEKYDINEEADTLNCSIIVPCFNSEKYIDDCLRSLILQKTNYSFEIICVNDGSTDGTAEILNVYKKRFNFIRVITQENQGLSISRNNAIKVAKGQYIVFLDSDDMLEENAIDIIVSRMLKERLDLLYFDASVFFDDADVEKKYKSHYPQNGYFRPSPAMTMNGITLFNFLYDKQRVVLPACLQAIRKEYFVDNKLEFPPNLLYEDNVFSIKALLLASRTWIEECKLYKRRIRKDSIVTSFKSYNHVRSYILVCKEIMDFINTSLSNKNVQIKVFNSIVSKLLFQAKKAFLTNSKNENFLLDKDKYGDYERISKYFEILTDKNGITYKLLTDKLV